MPMPMLTQAEWMPLLPHAGAMRLLDRVERWDASSITCQASSHKHRENPLRFDGCLPAVTGLEYAAQAMGIHTGLLNPDGLTAGSIGYVGGVRELVLTVERLDTLPDDLHIDATRLLEGEDSVMYQFNLTAGEQRVMHGRASIFLRRFTP